MDAVSYLDKSQEGGKGPSNDNLSFRQHDPCHGRPALSTLCFSVEALRRRVTLSHMTWSFSRIELHLRIVIGLVIGVVRGKGTGSRARRRMVAAYLARSVFSPWPMRSHQRHHLAGAGVLARSSIGPPSPIPLHPHRVSVVMEALVTRSCCIRCRAWIGMLLNVWIVFVARGFVSCKGARTLRNM